MTLTLAPFVIASTLALVALAGLGWTTPRHLWWPAREMGRPWRRQCASRLLDVWLIALGYLLLTMLGLGAMELMALLGRVAYWVLG